MHLNLDKPIYPFRPISSVRALAATLRLSEEALLEIASSASTMYRTVKPKPGSTRQTFDANGRLKPIHVKIKSAILLKVAFPDYLTGSLKGRNYKANASLHSNKSVVICEDVKGFFGSVSAERVYDTWRHFFNFDPKVAELLTQLTTKDGVLPQGGISSSFLANLVLWRDEPLLQAKLQDRGVTYSRYVDDIAMSSVERLSCIDKTELIAAVYGMLRKNGLSAHRDKHEIFPATGRMITTKLIVNRKPSLPIKRRSNVRVAVFQAEQAALGNGSAEEALTILNKAANRVGQLGWFHPNLAAPLKARLTSIRHGLSPEVPTPPLITDTPVAPDDGSSVST
jgi:ribosomal protein S20